MGPSPDYPSYDAQLPVLEQSLHTGDDFFHTVATSPEKKTLYPFPNVDTHVVPSQCQSKDIADVRQQTIAFIEDVLLLKPE